MLVAVVRLMTLVLREPRHLRGLFATPWARAYSAAMVPLAFALAMVGLEPALAVSPALSVAGLRLIILMWHDPRHVTALFATPWARACSIAFVAVAPLAFALSMIGAEPALAAVPAILIAVLRILILLRQECSA